MLWRSLFYILRFLNECGVRGAELDFCMFPGVIWNICSVYDEHKKEKTNIMKTIRKGLALLSKTILLALIGAMLTPILYFAWRAAQPMELPEFKGLTYYQFLEWRLIAQNELEVKYQVSHPQVKVKVGVCDESNRVVTFLVTPLQSLLYTFWSWRDDRNRLAMLEANYPVINEPVTWVNFMPSWWYVYEGLVLSLTKYTPHTSVVYCRLQPNIPTPGVFEIMKLEHQINTSN
jgi:hypothetical protein